MKSARDNQQRKLSCLSASLLVHGAIGATIALTPLTSASKRELPPTVTLQETTAMPKGEQVETLPPAPQTAATEPQPAPQPEPAAVEEQPKAEEVKAAAVVPAVQKPKAAKKVATVLPEKKTTTQAKADEPDLSVKAALEAARNEKSEVEPAEEGEPLLSAPALATQQEEEGIAPVAQQEEPATDASASAATAAVTEPQTEAKTESQTATETKTETQEAPPPVKKETPPSALAPAQDAAPAAAAATTTAGTGTGAQAAPPTPHGIRDADTLSQAPGNKNPLYPDRDRLARNQGTAVFVARVLPNGTVVDIKLEKSTLSKTLDASALEAMKKWRFLPGQEGWVRKAFSFSLNGNAQEMPARLRR